MYEIDYEMFEDLISKNPSIYDGKRLVFVSSTTNEKHTLKELVYDSSKSMKLELQSVVELYGRSTGSELIVNVHG